MRWMMGMMGIGIIAAGCGGETTTGSTSTGAGTTTGAGGTTATTTSATTGGGGQGGSGGATTTTSSASATSSSSATGSATSSTGTGMGAIFGATCLVNTDCASGLCANFMQKGMHCSVMCMSDADCPPESPGCGGQGVCKPPP